MNIFILQYISTDTESGGGDGVGSGEGPRRRLVVLYPFVFGMELLYAPWRLVFLAGIHFASGRFLSGRFAWVTPWRADVDLVLGCCCSSVVVSASSSSAIRRGGGRCSFSGQDAPRVSRGAGSCRIFQRLEPLVGAVVEVFPVLDVFSGGGDRSLQWPRGLFLQI